jgi:hypothetical protein
LFSFQKEIACGFSLTLHEMGDGFVKKEDILLFDKTIKDSLKNSSKKY